MSAPEKICVVTGAHGWLGRCVAAELRRRGWRVRAAVRAPSAEDVAQGGAVRFSLGENVPPEVCAGAAALVHCAYDFRARTWAEIERVNVRGAEQLFAAARAAGVEKVVAISSMSAFAGCVSLYGRAKLEIERAAAAVGALILRPGLVCGEGAGGMFGRLVAQVRGARVLPLFGGGAQVLYLVHERDLAAFIARFCEGEIAVPKQPLTAAHPRGWTLREILETIARRLGKKLLFFPLPWRAVWAALHAAEACGARLNFRSDSLVSLMNPDPRPDFSPNEKSGLECRPFQIEEVLPPPPPPL